MTPGAAVVPRQGWTPATFGMLPECGKTKPPLGYLASGCLYTTRIRFNPSVPGMVIAGTLGHGPWVSMGGQNWTPLVPQCLSSLRTVDNVSASAVTGNDGLTACGIEDIAFDPLDPKTIYLAGMNVVGIGLNSFHFDPGGIYKSTDSGTTWARVSKPLPNIRSASLAVIHEPGKKPVLITGSIQHADHDVGSDRSVSISYDDGATWAKSVFPVPRNCRNDDVSSSPRLVASIVAHPTNPKIIYAGTNGGLFMTNNQGRSWSLALSSCVSVGKVSLGAVWGIAFTPDGKFVYSAAWDGTVRAASVLTPTRWRTVAKLKGRSISALMIDARDPSGRTLYAAATDAERGGGREAAGVYRLDMSQSTTSVTVLADSWLAGPNHYLGVVPVRPYEIVKNGPALSLAQSTIDPNIIFLGQVAGGIYWRSEGTAAPNPTSPSAPVVPALPTAVPSVMVPDVPTTVPTATPSPSVGPA